MRGKINNNRQLNKDILMPEFFCREPLSKFNKGFIYKIRTVCGYFLPDSPVLF